jgi:hypothetical protein
MDLAIPVVEASICAISILPGKGDGRFSPGEPATNCGTVAAVETSTGMAKSMSFAYNPVLTFALVLLGRRREH